MDNRETRATLKKKQDKEENQHRKLKEQAIHSPPKTECDPA